MGSVAVWLAALLPSLVARVLAALGMGVITFTGFSIAWDSVRSIIVSNFSGMPSDIMALAGLAGVGQGLGIVLGAITARVAYMAITSARRIAGV